MVGADTWIAASGMTTGQNHFDSRQCREWYSQEYGGTAMRGNGVWSEERQRCLNVVSVMDSESGVA